MRSAVAQSLLADRQFDIEFQGYLSNHAKHAIVALDKLHAPDARIQEYWDQYTGMTPYDLALHPVHLPWDQVKPCSESEWAALRGKKEKWQAMCVFLQQELNGPCGGDTDELVRLYAPSVLSGMAGALTHGIIHLGWALEAKSSWMIVEGLAYLNFCHLGIEDGKLQVKKEEEGASTSTRPMDSMVQIAATFEKEHLANSWIAATKQKYDESFHPELVIAGFQWQLAKVLHEPHSVATQIPACFNGMPLTDLWENLYRTVVYVYLATRDKDGNGSFIVLHTITSLWALEQTCQVIGKDNIARKALQQFWATLICLMAASNSGFPSDQLLKQTQSAFPATGVDPDTYDWKPTVARGIAEEEEHNIKLVHVCKELWNRYGHWRGFSEAARSFTLTPSIGPTTTAFKA